MWLETCDHWMLVGDLAGVPVRRGIGLPGDFCVCCCLQTLAIELARCWVFEHIVNASKSRQKNADTELVFSSLWR